VQELLRASFEILEPGTNPFSERQGATGPGRAEPGPTAAVGEPGG
jgi:hypothetical protein